MLVSVIVAELATRVFLSFEPVLHRLGSWLCSLGISSFDKRLEGC